MGKRYVWVIRRKMLRWHINSYHRVNEPAFDILKPMHRTKKEALKWIKKTMDPKNYEVKKYEEV